MISGTGKKSVQKYQELKLNDQFLLGRKRKLDEDGDRNLQVITRKDYQKKDLRDFSREINVNSLSSSKSNNSSLTDSFKQDRLKQLKECLRSDDEKYEEATVNKGNQLNPISLDSLSEEGEESQRPGSPLLNIMQNDDQVEQEYINRMSGVKIEKLDKSKTNNGENGQKSKKFDDFSSNVYVDLAPKKISKKKKSAFENQSDFIGFPSKPETTIKPRRNSVSTFYDDGIEFPWLTEKSQNDRGMLKLHWEILEFYEFIRPNSKEDLLRERTIKVVKDLIKTNFPELKVKKFGSFPNKIHLPDSDIDIVVLCESKDGQPVDQLKLLKKITQKLIDNNLVDFIKIIEARVPIIRATLKETKINMDIR
jgi:predicted nucleotidyltransferase